MPWAPSVANRSAIARDTLWLAANRVNERFKLGFDAALAPHRVVVRTQEDAG